MCSPTQRTTCRVSRGPRHCPHQMSMRGISGCDSRGKGLQTPAPLFPGRKALLLAYLNPSLWSQAPFQAGSASDEDKLVPGRSSHDSVTPRARQTGGHRAPPGVPTTHTHTHTHTLPMPLTHTHTHTLPRRRPQQSGSSSSMPTAGCCEAGCLWS